MMLKTSVPIIALAAVTFTVNAQAQDAGVVTQDAGVMAQDDEVEPDLGDSQWDVVVEDDSAIEGTAEDDDDDYFVRAGDDFGVKLHGSFENQLTFMWPNQYNGEERLYVYDYTRLRIDLDADLPGGLQLRSDVVARLFVGDTDFYIVNIIPAKAFDDLVARDPRWQAAMFDKYELENEIYLDNVYLKVPIAKTLLVLGKQPVEQGAGYAWNPTDVFTRKEMMDPTYEKPGVIALRLMIPIGESASLDFLGAPDGSFEHWGYGGRGALRLGPLSLSAASYVTRVKRTDLEGSMDAMMAAAMLGQDPEEAVIVSQARRTMVGGDVILDIEGVRLWAEGAYNFVENKSGAPKDWWELVGGAEYFFPFQTHLMVEYFHYGEGGEQHGGTYDFNSWMQLLTGELKMLGRDFLFESIDHPVADFWTLGLSSFQSLSDGSAAIMGDVRWEFVQDAELWLLVVADVGDKEDFLASAKGQAWLRLKVYF